MLFFIYLAFNMQAQYMVKKVEGNVYLKNKALQIKDRINVDDTLRFSSINDCVSVFFPGKGYYFLALKKDKKAKGEFISALKDALMPPNEFYAAATRSNELYESVTFEDQYDLKAFFRDELFFVAPAKFKVSAAHFPLDSNHFFMIRHQLEDGWIGKALPHTDQTFELNQRVFQLQSKIFDEHIIQHSELYYINRESGEEQYLGQFKLQFPAVALIKEDLTILYDAAGNIPTAQFLREHALPFLYFHYGKTQREAIEQLVAQIQQKK